MGTRQERMTPAERMAAVMMGQKPDRIPCMPFILGFAAVVTGYKVGEFYAEPEKSFRAQLLCQEMFGYDGSPLYGYASYGAWEVGGEIRFPYGEWEQAPVVTKQPWSTPEAIERYQVPEDVSGCGAVPHMLRFADLQAQSGMPVTVPAGCVFTCTGNAIGVERMLRWMYKDKQLVHLALSKMKDFQLKVIELFVSRYGAERIMVINADPSNSNELISPEQFEEFALPYITEIHDKAIAMGIRQFFTHICGEQNQNLGHWKKVNFGYPGIVSVGHQVDLEKAANVLGEGVIIAGNLNTTIIQMGTPEEVYNEALRCIEQGKRIPRFILMAACEVPVLAPPINIFYIMKALREHGFYD